MARPERKLKRPFVLFCEGDTEYNYFDKMRHISNLDITLNLINMHGGGYNNFLKEIKKHSRKDCLASFIIVDGDRAQNINDEKENLKKLIDHCTDKNKDKLPPYILIINYPDFEYIACLHDPEYKGGDTKQHIEKNFNYTDIEKFKKEKNIFEFLNTEPRHHKNIFSVLEKKLKVISNEIEDRKTNISVINTNVNFDALGQKGSNICEFFSIIDEES